MEPEDVKCPECDAVFYVVWNNIPETQGGPDYCPFCGEAFDYDSSQNKGNAANE